MATASTASSFVLRVETLDALRGVAASFVVAHHVCRTAPGLDSAAFWSSSSAQAWWVYWVFLGDLAVTVFFVLSGASLAYASRCSNQQFSSGSFLIKRFFRIYPLYFLVLWVYFAFRPVYAYLVPNPPADWLSPQFVLPIQLEDWVQYLTMTFNLLG